MEKYVLFFVGHGRRRIWTFISIAETAEVFFFRVKPLEVKKKKNRTEFVQQNPTWMCAEKQIQIQNNNQIMNKLHKGKVGFLSKKLVVFGNAE